MIAFVTVRSNVMEKVVSSPDRAGLLRIVGRTGLPKVFGTMVSDSSSSQDSQGTSSSVGGGNNNNKAEVRDMWAAKFRTSYPGLCDPVRLTEAQVDKLSSMPCTIVETPSGEGRNNDVDAVQVPLVRYVLEGSPVGAMLVVQYYNVLNCTV